MANETEIAWTDSTFNPWIGCTNVSAGCDHCYAEALNDRRGWTQWGPHGNRKRTSASNWQNPLRWQRAAEAFRKEHGRRRRVFCASLADVFDNHKSIDPSWRADLFKLIRATPDLDWQFLTKRPENIPERLPDDWGIGYPNVWLGTTTEDQKAYDHRWPLLLQVPAIIRFISYEPAIGPLRIGDGEAPTWIIYGGESGPGARVANPQWARDLFADTFGRSVFFVKQHGTYASNPLVFERLQKTGYAMTLDPPANGKGGALIDMTGRNVAFSPSFSKLFRNFPDSDSYRRGHKWRAAA